MAMSAIAFGPLHVVTTHVGAFVRSERFEDKWYLCTIEDRCQFCNKPEHGGRDFCKHMRAWFDEVKRENEAFAATQSKGEVITKWYE
jgi:hypothetical protein